MLEPGIFISERYEIIDKVGTGGTADVYKARCHRLNRFVAVKVLKSEYSDDKSFVEKFRAEAQSAAGLSHPNIVNVYDVGEDNGLYYIVMELVEGITLKDFVERKGKLAVKEALAISIQIAQGMEAAHENHIIHRDIKPQNIIISKDGKVKVTDFGIAKAATSATIKSNAMGSVHYISPERARGGYSDARSDIYSLGVTMYEMLSGHVPFTGDNNVSVALMHIQKEAQPLHLLVPDIPPVIEHIVEKCMQKKPEFRYQITSELIRDLRRAIANTDEDFVRMPENTVTDSPTIHITDEELSQIRSSARNNRGTAAGTDAEPVTEADRDYAPVGGSVRRVEAADAERTERSASRSGAEYAEDRQRTGSGQYTGKGDHMKQNHTPVESRNRGGENTSQGREKEAQEELDEDEIEPRLKKVMLIVGVTTAIILVIVLIVIAIKITGVFHKTTDDPYQNTQDNPLDNTEQNGLLDDPQEPDNDTQDEETVSVPDVQEYDGETAQEMVEEKGLKAVIEQKYDDEIKKGYVISQSPAPDTEVNLGDTVTIVVSLGAEEKEPDKVTFSLDNLVGKTEQEAVDLLNSKKLKYTRESEYSSSVEPGRVIRTSPAAGSTVEEEQTITLYISDGPETVTYKVPQITNVSEQTARELLEENHLEVGEVSHVYSSSYEAGTVMGQDIKKGTEVPEGTAVGFTVSKGPKEEEEPDEPPEETVYYYADYYIGYENSPLDDEEEGEITLVLTQDGNETTLYSKTITGADFPLSSTIRSTSNSAGRLNMLLDGADTGFQTSVTFKEE